MRRLVQHDEVVRVVGDGDRPRGGVEDAGIATGRPADGLLDGQRLVVVGPRQADPGAQRRERGREQAADLPGPRLVVGPGADDDLDRLALHGGLDRRVGIGTRAVADEVREEVERLGKDATPEDLSTVARRRGRGDAPRLDGDLVSLRKDHRDRAARGLVARECPHRERHQRVADAQVARGLAAGVLEVERETVLGGLAAGQVLREVEP